jgi:hypothetical protein
LVNFNLFSSTKILYYEAFKHSSIQAFKHSSIQAFKHSSIQAFKHSSIQAFLTILCLSLVTTFTLNSQNECNTPHPTNDPLKAFPQANTTGDPIYVKVYATIPRLSDGTMGASEETFREEFEFAQAALKEHNIYLGLGCLTELHNSDAYYNLSHPAYNTYSDGLNLKILDRSIGGVAGRAGGIPSKTAWADVTSISTLAHEIGHCLGLLHPFNANECNCQPNAFLDCEKVTRDPNDPNYNCEDAGDYVCDTEANSGQNINADCQTLATTCTDIHGDPFQPNIDNIMSYFSKDCRTVFTPGQGARMRSFLVTDPDMMQVTRNDLIIKGQTKSFNGYADLDILFLDAGPSVINTLENSNIQFAPDKGIKVLGGEYNIINNCTLTSATDNACNEVESVQLWEGIEVSTKIFISDSDISYAKRAVYNDNTVQTRTELWVEYSNFTDNTVAIDQETSSSSSAPSWAVVNTCTFDYSVSRTGFPLQQHIRTLGSRMWITRSTFDQSFATDPKSPDLNSAIYNYGSQLTVLGTPTIQNKFRDFSTTIQDLGNFLNYGIPRMENNEFKDNYKAISSLASTPRIKDNQVIMRNKKSGSAEAFALNRCDQFELSGNRVENPYTGSTDIQRLAWITRTGVRNNMVDNNTAEACRNLLFVVGTSGSPSGRGLMFTCNESINGDKHDFNLFGNVHPIQGTPAFPANNEFANTALDPVTNGPLSNRDIYNAGSYTLDYYWDTDFPSHEPDESFNVDDDPTIPQRTQCTPGSSLSSAGTNDEIEHEVRYQELTSALDTLYSTSATDTSKALLHSLWAKEFERDILIRDALIQLSNPSDSIDENLVINYDSVRTWLNRYDDMWSRIQVAKTYLQEGDTTGYDQYITTIPSLGAFSEEEMSAYNDFKDAVQIIRIAEGEGRSRATLNEIEQADMYQMATSNDTYVGQYAKNLLRTFYGYTFQEPPTPNLLLSEERIAVKEKAQPFFYPNPTENELKFILPNKESTYWAQIRNLRGHLMHEQRVADEQVIQVGQFPSGLYVVSIQGDNGDVEVQKLYIQ